MLEQLDKVMFNKDFRKAQQFPPLQGLSSLEASLDGLLRSKAIIYDRLAEGERLSKAASDELSRLIQDLPLESHPTEFIIQRCLLRASVSQFLMQVPPDHERELETQTKQLPPLQRALSLPLYQNIAHLPYVATCLLECYIRRLCMISIDSAFIDELSTALGFHIKVYQTIVKNPGQYVNGLAIMRSLYSILVHRLISYYNTNLKVQYRDVLTSYCSMFGPVYSELMTDQLRLCLLYNILKILAPLNEQEEFDLSAVFGYLRVELQPQLLKQKIFCLFHKLNELIDERSHRLLNSGGQNEQAQREVRTHLWPQLYIFCSINLNSITLKLQEVVMQIITHRLPSLLSFISLRYQMTRATKAFVEKVYDSPFNHEVQTIKLCFELFNSEEFEKLSQLADNVLSSEGCKHLHARQILIVMCSIFKGVVMENFDQGLVFAKLNHYEFTQKSKEARKASILQEETLLEHVGFAYYNAAKHSQYLSNKLVYSAKALENFLKSYDLNRENYLLSYSLGKLYLQNYDYDAAYKFATAACKNNKDNWEPFALLACVYMCRKKHHKAEMIVKELLNRHPNCPALYYIRAYTEAYKILQDVYTNEEVEASKFLGNEYYESYKERVLRSKDVRHVLQLLQRYFRMYVYELYDEVAYDQQFLVGVRLDPDMYQDQLITANYFKALTNCFDVLLHLDQVALCEQIVRKLMTETRRQDFSYRYYKGKVHEKKKELGLAAEEYNQLLLNQPYHPQALISLSLLEKDDDKANQYVELASKFSDDDDFNYAKGMYLSRIGEFERAHSFFLKEARTCWLDSLPDFMYYY